MLDGALPNDSELGRLRETDPDRFDIWILSALPRPFPRGLLGLPNPQLPTWLTPTEKSRLMLKIFSEQVPPLNLAENNVSSDVRSPSTVLPKRRPRKKKTSKRRRWHCSPEWFASSVNELLTQLLAANPKMKKREVTKLIRPLIENRFSSTKTAVARSKETGVEIPLEKVAELARLRRERIAELIGCSVEKLPSIKDERARLQMSDWTRLIRQVYPAGLENVDAVKRAVYAFERPPRRASKSRAISRNTRKTPTKS